MPYEFKRELRVLDMIITAHSCERDKYLSYDRIVTIIILFFSVILCTFSFIPKSEFIGFGISKDIINIVVPLTSAGILVLSIIQLFSRWKEKAQEHANCVTNLSKLKGEYKLLQSRDSDDDSRDKISIKYNDLLSSKPIISDKHFIKYKRHHYRKIELSKMIDNNPGLPLFILKLKLLFSALKTIFSKT